MTRYIALLRGINVGGVILPMAELRTICETAGLKNVRTYIQSGNVLFDSSEEEDALVSLLEARLEAHKTRQIRVVIRTGRELEATLSGNPFPHAPGARVGVLFLPETPPADLLEDLVIPGREEVVASGRELLIHYPDGMGRSKLKLPKAVAAGTMRNMNTVAKLEQLSRESAQN